MKADVLSLEGNKIKSINLPVQFEEGYRPDLIKRAIFSIWSRTRQRYGAKPGAGMRYSAKLSKRRRKYRGSYGHGISRVPRKILWRRGRQFGWVGAVAPGTVGGRRAHPPKASKILEQKINKKERRKAIRSAISALALEKKLIILESKLESLKRTKDLKNILLAIKLEDNLERLERRKVREGKGKIRGRKYRRRLGPLLVVSKPCNVTWAVGNLQGFDVVEVKNLNAMLLTEGQDRPRLTIWSESAIETLGKEKLFLGIKEKK